jgi:hypothetical protein
MHPIERELFLLPTTGTTGDLVNSLSLDQSVRDAIFKLAFAARSVDGAQAAAMGIVLGVRLAKKGLV